MTLVIVLLVAVVLLAIAAIGLRIADTRCAALAETKAAAFVSAPFGHPATVRVRHRPFLPQAVRGVYREVEVVGTLALGELDGTALAAHLTNVHLPLRDLIGGRVTELPCERAQGRLVVRYDSLARASHVPGLTLAFDGVRLMASVTISSSALPTATITSLISSFVPVALPLGSLTRITGEARLSLGGGGSVWLRLRHVTVGGIVVPAVVLGQLLPALSMQIPVPDLPYGLHLDELTPTATGLVVDASAEAFVLR